MRTIQRVVGTVFAVALFWALLSGCTPGTQPPPPPTSAPATSTAAPLPLTPTRDPARYYNEQGGFSLKLPDGWTVVGPVTTSAENHPSYDLYMLGVDPASSGGPGASLIAIADASGWTPAGFARAQCTTCPVPKLTPVTIGGVEALRAEVGGGGVPIMTTWYFVEHEGQHIAFAIHDPQTMEPLEDVIQSFRFD